MNAFSRSARCSLLGKSTIRSRFRLRMPNHCSTWFIHEQCTGGWWNTNRGCCASHACTGLPLCIRRLSSTTWMTVTSGPNCRSSSSRKAVNSSCRLRSAVSPYTLPVRVSKAANRFNAPHRPYACSTRTGWPGAAARVGALRGRGCRSVFAATPSTPSWGPNARVYRAQTSCTRAAKSASRGPLGDSHRWWRQGLRWWFPRMRRTVSAAIRSTTPSRASGSARARQSHWDKERPSLSGRSQAILTRCRATEGGKGGLAPAARLVGEALQALGEVAPGPLAGVADGQPGGAGGVLEGVAAVQQPRQAGAADQPVAEGRRTEPTFQFPEVSGGGLDGERRFAAAHRDKLRRGKQRDGGNLGGLS